MTVLYVCKFVREERVMGRQLDLIPVQLQEDCLVERVDLKLNADTLFLHDDL